MNKGMLLRVVVCIFLFSVSLYSYIDQQNDLTQMRIQAPKLVKEIKAIKEENTRLKYEIDQFENPEHLMELSRHSEYSHLKHPLLKEILVCQEGVALSLPSETKGHVATPVKPKVSLAIGAK